MGMKDSTIDSIARILVGLFIAGCLVGLAILSATAANALYGSGGTAERQASVFTRGSTDVLVYYCAPAGQYTLTDLDNEVTNLNVSVTDFFFRESSGLARVNFKRGGIITPEDVDFANTTIRSMHEVAATNGQLTQCHSPRHSGHHALVLTEASADGIAGFAYQGQGFSMVAAPNAHPNRYELFLVTVAHELGHAIFDLPHTREITEPCTDEINWSVMNRRECVSSYLINLQSFEIVCEQRQQLNWPCDARSNATRS